jgi:hypothetical protein
MDDFMYILSPSVRMKIIKGERGYPFQIPREVENGL